MANKIHYIIIFGIGLISLINLSCSTQVEEEAIIPFSVLNTGFYTSIQDKRQVVIKNNSEYMKLMDEVYSNLDQKPNIPDVDFSKNYVVALFMGMRTSGGYAINVDKVINRKDAVTVAVYETSPGKDCMVTDAITYPYEIAKIPRMDKEIKFLIKPKVNECK